MPLDDHIRQRLAAMTDRPLSVITDLASVHETARRKHRERVLFAIAVSAILIAALAITSVLVVQDNDASKPRVNTPANNAPATTAPPGTSSGVPATTTVLPTPGTPAPGSISQDLTFTGRYTGHVTVADPANSGEVLGPHLGADPSLPPACTSSLATQTGSDGAVIGIVSTLAGQRLRFSYSVENIHDPTHGLNEPVAQFGTDKLVFDPTKVVVDPDRDGALVDSDLFYYSNEAPVVVGHVTGHFRCAPSTTVST